MKKEWNLSVGSDETVNARMSSRHSRPVPAMVVGYVRVLALYHNNVPEK